MRQSNKLIAARRNKICDTLANSQGNTLSVNDLAKLFNVSSMTIRRDLSILEEMGRVQRSHGSATLVKEPFFEGYTDNQNIESIKCNLAKIAARYIKDGDIVFINSSSTALLALDYVDNRDVHFITNNLNVHKFDISDSNTLTITGGELRRPKDTLVGNYALGMISEVYADLAIIGTSGISSEGGITTENINEGKINAQMILNAKFSIAVADYRKVDHISSIKVTPIHNLDLLITDTYADEKALEKIELSGVSVIQV
ncbi:DeoR family transcriptional regulator [Suicoccus acidiformans]|uniref:DeoR family transcriptional regulator n=1 Tax=Suicoccus acidiformans TaxID=2036206 RepID=A0A347WIG5_9LACT|nr:DeoR/GlpR family DNA-binding transcription regulator [Suicoccus acidiformans]AXY24872.1 DeoR family transcriptional regulator [Suicoccus acidiformans]